MYKSNLSNLSGEYIYKNVFAYGLRSVIKSLLESKDVETVENSSNAKQ